MTAQVIQFPSPAVRHAAAEVLPPPEPTVTVCPAYHRIRGLPIRDWVTEQHTTGAVEIMSRWLTKGDAYARGVRLFPAQAQCLVEAADHGRLYARLPVGGGKEQRIDEPVLTPSGWRAIGDLQPGDYVIGANGKPTEVLAVHPQGVKTSMRLTFSDGSFAHSGLDHLWTFQVLRGGDRRLDQETRTLAEWMRQPLRYGKQLDRVFVQTTEPVEFSAVPALPLDPYTLGVLIGDAAFGGCTPILTLGNADLDIIDHCKFPDGVEPNAREKSGCWAYSLGAGRAPLSNPLTDTLRELGLWGLHSTEKFIPTVYLRASIDDRLSMLQGLLDTDGSVAKAAVHFSTSSPHLHVQVRELVETLGGTAAARECAGRPGQFEVRIKLPSGLLPFRCQRKLDQFLSFRNNIKRRKWIEPRRALRSIEYDGVYPSVCITVAAEDGLYLTRHCIVTHNTIISFLLPLVLNLPPWECALLIPAHLREKTRLDFAAYARDWQVAMPKLVSYQGVGANDKALPHNVPLKLIIADEAWMLFNRKSNRWRRIEEYLERHPQCRFVALSGTFIHRDLRETSHILQWSLRDYSPVPRWSEYGALDSWHSALSENVEPEKALKPGPLLELTPGPHTGEDDRAKARGAFKLRCNWTPGLVSTDHDLPDCTIEVRAVCPPVDVTEDLNMLFAMLRQWKTPNGDEIVTSVDMWRHASTLVCGYINRWTVKPPDDWMAARTAWKRLARYEIKNNGKRLRLFSERDVARAVDRAIIGSVAISDTEMWESKEILNTWRLIEPSYKPVSQAVWFSYSMLDWVAEWIRTHPHGLVWTAGRPFGFAMEARHRIPYFHSGAKSSAGKHMSAHTGPAILAIKSCSTGLNLQWYRDNLIVGHTAKGGPQQLIGRTARTGQRSQIVSVDWVAACREQLEGIWSAVADAHMAQEIDSKQLLASATKLIPTLEDADSFQTSHSLWANRPKEQQA